VAARHLLVSKMTAIYPIVHRADLQTALDEMRPGTVVMEETADLTIGGDGTEAAAFAEVLYRDGALDHP